MCSGNRVPGRTTVCSGNNGSSVVSLAGSGSLTSSTVSGEPVSRRLGPLFGTSSPFRRRPEDGERVGDLHPVAGKGEQRRGAAARAPGRRRVAGRNQQATPGKYALQVGRRHAVTERGRVQPAQRGNRELLGSQCETEIGVTEFRAQPVPRAQHDRLVVERGPWQFGHVVPRGVFG